MDKESRYTVTDSEAVVQKYAGMVYKLAYAQVHTRSDADDVFQEVFLRYFRKTPQFETEEHQKAWLIRVTVNCSKKYWSSAWNRKVIPINDDLAAPSDEESGLREALGRLPDKYRAVIHLFYYEGYPISEISGILKVKQSTVRTQLTRARSQLGEMLKGEY